MSETPFGAGDVVLVIGLGRSGLASTRVLRERGAQVYAVDEQPAERLRAAIDRIVAEGAQFVQPAELARVLGGVRAAVVSPGVPMNGALVQRVQAANVPVYSEIEVAYRLCSAPLVAITGTKGKSTTTALTGHLLRAGGKRVFVGGNIGNPLIAEVTQASPEDWVVAEVSSFQLESIRSFRPHVSVLLNISADHLDRYYSMDEYAEAKYRVFANQSEHDFFVGNLDDERLRALHWHTGEGRIRARQLWFTMGDRHEHASLYLRSGRLVYTPPIGDPRPIELFSRDDIPLAGEHNVQNVMAACLAALAAGAAPNSLRDAVRSFAPMSHRLQPVRTLDGVLYVDDSKATNPGAAIAALRAYEAPVILIAGGKSKNTDFTELGRAIDARAKALIAIGDAAGEIAAHVYRTPVRHTDSMGAAVEAARELAAEGDVVLLSPACASFDMFTSAEDRGDRFQAAVAALSAGLHA